MFNKYNLTNEDISQLDEVIKEAITEFNDQESKLLIMSNDYVMLTPADQILSNQINNLIQYFGRDKVNDMFKIFYPKKG